jgi:hypothetical protein
MAYKIGSFVAPVILLKAHPGNFCGVVAYTVDGKLFSGVKISTL